MSEALLAQALRSHQAGNLLEAAKLYSSVLQSNPRNFQALYLLGFIHMQMGQFEQAARLIGESVKINPNSPDAFYNLGCALQNAQRHEEAIAAFDRAIGVKPDYDEAHANCGSSLLALKRYAEAVSSFDLALKIKPHDAETLSNRATALFEAGRYEDAAAANSLLITVAPEFPYALGNLALARAYSCDWRFIKTDHAKIVADIRAGKAAISSHGSTLLLDDANDQLLCAQDWVRSRAPASTLPLWRGERYTHDKIRIAYLSADFHAHATSFLIAGLFEHHDRNRFDISLVSFGQDDGSEMRSRLARSCDRFLDVSLKSDSDIAALLRQMETDIAIDLKGFTQGSRPGIFAARPAPIQINYLGHPGTMGAPYVDYLIADNIVIPLGHDHWFSEKIICLPDSYQANDSRRQIAEEMPTRVSADLPEKGFVFCCFNNNYKITPSVFDIWMRLLARTEGSVLWLLADNQAAMRNLKREASARGVSAERLIFAPRVPIEQHLARHRLADLFLDTVPCNAHTTASDALWSGLPLLTVRGTTFAGRVGTSLVQAIGLPELVASDLEDYEAKATRLSTDANHLQALKARLWQNRLVSPLFDTRYFTQHFESALEEAYARYQHGLPPDHISVSRVR